MRGENLGQQKVEVRIRGTSPLLMHRFPLDPVEGFEKMLPEKQAEVSAYRHPKTRELVIPGLNVQRALVSGATYSKGKGRSSLQKVVAACLMVSPEYLSLGVKDYELDKRAVVNPVTGGRIIRYRPRLDEWGCMFFLEFDDTLLTEAQVRRVVDDTGQRVGLLDFRPEHKGPFGRYMVVSWESAGG